ncbi:MAG: hypothetical protein ACLVIY_12555 [Anaerobutyricum soehngenii]
MVNLISTGSNYIIIIMGVIYAISCFTVFLPSSEKVQAKRMDRQELVYVCVPFYLLWSFIRQNIRYED